METQEITKEQNIFNLYDQLLNNGSKGKAITFISELTGVRKSTIKGNWFSDREIPLYLLNDHQDKVDAIIDYLQKQIALQNESETV